MIFLTSNLPAMPFRYDLPINYRDGESSGRRKRTDSMAGGVAPLHSHSRVRGCVGTSSPAGALLLLWLGPPCCFCLLMCFLTPTHRDWCTPLSCADGHLGCGDSPQSWEGEELGTSAPGPLSLGGGVEGQRLEARLLFPACPGEPPSPRGHSHEGGGVCERLALLEETVCIKPFGLHLTWDCVLPAVFHVCVGSPTRLTRRTLSGASASA